MKLYVTRKECFEPGAFSYDYVAERPWSGSITTKYHDNQEKADESIRKEFQVNHGYNEVVIFDQSFPT